MLIEQTVPAANRILMFQSINFLMWLFGLHRSYSTYFYAVLVNFITRPHNHYISMHFNEWMNCGTHDVWPKQKKIARHSIYIERREQKTARKVSLRKIAATAKPTERTKKVAKWKQTNAEWRETYQIVEHLFHLAGVFGVFYLYAAKQNVPKIKAIGNIERL